MNGSGAAPSRPHLITDWTRSTTFLLLVVGGFLAVIAFALVLRIPDLIPASSAARVESSYDTFLRTGIPLIDVSPSDGAFVPAGAGSAPGPYLLTYAVGATLGGLPSAWQIMQASQALAVAVPLLWLPLAVARVFQRGRAGYAVMLLPGLTWLLNNGTVLVGTHLGLPQGSDRVSQLTGLGASLAFAGLALLLLLSTLELSRRKRMWASLGMAALSGGLGLFDTVAGVSLALGVGALWWLGSPLERPRRARRALVAASLVMLAGLGIQGAAATAVNAVRAPSLEATAAELPVYPVAWPDLLQGLVAADSGATDAADVATRSAATVEGVTPGTTAWESALRDRYVGAVSSHPVEVAGVYFSRFLFVIKESGALIGFVVVGLVVALTRRVPQRGALAAAVGIALPGLVLGVLSATVLPPDVENRGLLTAALGLLSAVTLGGLVWSITSMPSHVRTVERSRLSRRSPRPFALPRLAGSSDIALSAIIPTRNGATVLPETVATLADTLGRRDEIIVVENGSTDRTSEVLDTLQREWRHPIRLVVRHSAPGLGEALRAGVLASRGQRLLLSADDLPFGFSDLDQFRQLPEDVVVAIGSKAHPASRVSRSRLRDVQSRIFRFLRSALLQSRVGDSQGTLWTEGEWGRSFAHLSRESGLMWTTELVLAAEQQRVRLVEVPVVLHERHEKGASRFRLGDAWSSVIGFTRLAVYKDDYFREDWIRDTHADEDPAIAS